MKSLDTIKKRINSIYSVKKITNAMKSIAIAKIKKQHSLFLNANNFCKDYYSIFALLVDQKTNFNIFKTKQSSNNSTLYFLITSTLGLCGSYNSNICKYLLTILKPDDRIVVFGKKGYAFLKQQGFANKIICTQDINISKDLYYSINPISYKYVYQYLSGQFSQIKLIYTHFKSQIDFTVKNISMLPIDETIIQSLQKINNGIARKQFIVEPSKNKIIKDTLPVYFSNLLYGAIIESFLCEFSSRRNAMDKASNNATELVDNLSLQYNQIRQEKITQEINEIISGVSSNE